MSDHPDLTRWTDYLRGLADGDESAALRRHLDNGCERCSRQVAALRRLDDVARVDVRQPLPEAAVRAVKAVAALHRPERGSSLDPIRLALLTDTRGAAVAGGIRHDGSPSDRALLFEAGELRLDLSVASAPGVDAGREVIGSCFHTAGDPLAGAAVLAVHDDRIVDRAVTGDLGEFRLAELPAADLELWVIAGSGRPLVAELDLSG